MQGDEEPSRGLAWLRLRDLSGTYDRREGGWLISGEKGRYPQKKCRDTSSALPKEALSARLSVNFQEISVIVDWILTVSGEHREILVEFHKKISREKSEQ